MTLTDEWEALADSLAAPPFMRPGWFAAWDAAFGSGPSEPIAIRRKGELVALLPMRASRAALRAPVNWHSPLLTPLAADEAAEHDLLARLFEQPQPLVSLGQLPAGDGLPARVAAVAAAHSRRVVSATVARSPVIALDGDLASYDQTLSRNRRRAMRRGRRRLGEAGEVTFEVCDGTERLSERLEEVFRVEAAGWKGDLGTAIASRPDTRRFYTEVARWAASRGWLRLAFLRLDGEPIACDLALEHDGSWYTLKAGYDERWRSCGPGALLMHREIVHCFAIGLAKIELLGNDDEFKSSWTDRHVGRVELRAFRRDLTGTAAWASALAEDRARRWYRARRSG